MRNEIKCPKCGGAMTEGFVLDFGDYEYKRQQIWVEGEPNESFWSGVKVKGAKACKVRAFRCAGCGFLEFYADEESDIGSSMWTI